MATSISIAESVTNVTVSPTASTSITVDTSSATSVSVNPTAIPTVTAESIAFTPHNAITATTVEGALQQLADQQFRGTTAPTAGTTNLSEGDFFYDTDDDQLKVYRETSTGTFEFVPIMVGNISPDSDTVDAGAF